MDMAQAALMPLRRTRVALLAIASGLLGSGAAAQELGAHIQAAYAEVGTQGCMICHDAGAPLPAGGILQSPHALTGNPRSPLANGGHQCESCHGPSATHLGMVDGVRPPPAVAFAADEQVSVKDAVCLGCHERETGMHWPSSAHHFAEVACTDCHVAHTARDPVLTSAGEVGVCYQCHARERAEFFRRSAHPIMFGLMQCTDCHLPHGSAAQGLLRRMSVNDTCYDCHAEKRGPFLWEHVPVREDCSNCHVPHGSNHANLLRARAPFLCQQCHLAAFHPSTALSGASLPPQGASHLALAQNCMNCHSQVHGSNHPSGPGLTR